MAMTSLKDALPVFQKNSMIINCATCGSELDSRPHMSKEQNLRCSSCSSTYSFRDDYLNVLPPKIRKEICTKGIIARKIKNQLHVEELTKDEHDLIKGILASKYMAKQYFKNVVHPTKAVWSARSYERYEDILITNYLDNLLSEKEVTFVDAGSGPGRYLILLGSKISPGSCKELKRHSETEKLYRYNKLYDKNLRYIVGIDYSEEMVSHSARLLRRYGLGKFLNERIFPVTGVAQNFHFNDKLLKDTHRVIVCTFQTLGNQENLNLQVNMLQSMKKLASPHGTIIISVFNKKLFKDFGLKKFYGREVRRTVGEIINSKEDEDNAILRTSKGVYSKWFSKDDLEDLLHKAKISKFEIMDEKTLQPITGFEEYLKVEEQRKDVFPRAIVAIAQI